MKQNLTPEEELDFNTKYGCMFSLSATKDYAQMVQGIFGQQKNNYGKNVAKRLEDACTQMDNVLRRDVVAGMTEAEKFIALSAIEQQKNIIYSFFILSTKSQHRIEGLIKKLQREEREQEILNFKAKEKKYATA